MKKIRICKNHPNSPWAKDETGKWHQQCYFGHTTATTCEILKIKNGQPPAISCVCGKYGRQHNTSPSVFKT